LYGLSAGVLSYHAIRSATNSLRICNIILYLIIVFGVSQNFKRPDQNPPKRFTPFSPVKLIFTAFASLLSSSISTNLETWQHSQESTWSYAVCWVLHSPFSTHPSRTPGKQMPRIPLSTRTLQS